MIVPPSGGTNVSVAPFWKLLPLIVKVWLPFSGTIEGGDTLLMEGDALVMEGGDTPLMERVDAATGEGADCATAATVKLLVPDDCPFGLFTFTVHVPESLRLLI